MDLLKRQSLLKVISWNIDFASPGPTQRITSILQYLQNTFGDSPGQLAILLQEVCPNSAKMGSAKLYSHRPRATANIPGRNSKTG
jgi:hypothetical protein